MIALGPRPARPAGSRRTAPRLGPAALLAVLIAASLPSAVAAAGDGRRGLQGRDDRVAVEADAYPWNSIGRLNNQGKSFCTAVLIAPDRVLTAAHCVRSHVAGRAWAPPSAVHFLAGYRRGHYLAHSTASAITVAPAPAGRQDRGADFAIVTLARPMRGEVRPLPVERFDAAHWLADRHAGVRYAQAGYSRDRAHILTRNPRCGIIGFQPDGALFAHDCDATFGDSGSPILVRRGSGYAVVGLHVATSRNGRFGVAIAGDALRAGLRRVVGLLPRTVSR